MRFLIALTFGGMTLLWFGLLLQLFARQKVQRQRDAESVFIQGQKEERARAVEHRLQSFPFVDQFIVRFNETGLRLPWTQVLFTGLAVFAGWLVLSGVFGSVRLVLFGLVAAVIILFIWYRVLKRRHHQKLLEVIPYFLDLVYDGLRAGYTQRTAWELAVEQAPAPLDRYVQKHFALLQHHRSVEECLRDLTEELQLRDLDIVVSSVSVQQTIGGPLAPLIRSVSRTMRQRIKLQRDVRALTSQGRLSGYLVAALWPISFVLFSFLSPGYFDVLFSTLLGQALLIVSIALELLGFWVIAKIIDIQL